MPQIFIARNTKHEFSSNLNEKNVRRYPKSLAFCSLLDSECKISTPKYPTGVICEIYWGDKHHIYNL